MLPVQILLLILLAIVAATNTDTANNTGEKRITSSSTSFSSSSSSSLNNILVSTSIASNTIIYSCFFTTNDSDNNNDINDNAVPRSKKCACCKGIANAREQLFGLDGASDNDKDNDNNNQNDNISDADNEAILLYQRCVLEVAQVPSVAININNNNNETIASANFSWTVPATTTLAKQSKVLLKSATMTTSQFISTNHYSHGNDDDNDDNRHGNNDMLQLQTIQTISPYHMYNNNNIKTTQMIVDDSSSSSSSSSSNILNSTSTVVTSNLGRDGGMHRLFHHSFQPIPTDDVNHNDLKKISFYLFVTIPQGMFIDLDDPFEAASGSSFTKVDESSATASSTKMNKNNKNNVDDDNSSFGSSASSTSTFVVTTTRYRPEEKYIEELKLSNNTNNDVMISSFRIRLHSATICDIEQPAFDSGQHILIWEIDNIEVLAPLSSLSNNNKHIPVLTPFPVIKFATKVHLRYPRPSSSMEVYIDLPQPFLLSSSSSTSQSEPINEKQQQQHSTNSGWTIGSSERVWVAAGHDHDHDYIMIMTISVCLIGVVIMLWDISIVSLWDDV